MKRLKKTPLATIAFILLNTGCAALIEYPLSAISPKYPESRDSRKDVYSYLKRKQKQRIRQGECVDKYVQLKDAQVERKQNTSQERIAYHHLKAQKRADKEIKAREKQISPPERVKKKLSKEDLMQQIAQLGAAIREQSLEKTRIKAVNSVSTHKHIAAQYLRGWTQKVSGVGNLNFPEIARKKGCGGKLILDVGIAANGTIYSISVRKSSGVAALDAAAKHIVRMAAPFTALPKKLLGELDVLVISRVWEFHDEAGKASNY